MDCGGVFPACCYDFDHRDPFDKKFTISNVSARNSVPMEEIEKEVDKCDLVCANCHRLRSWGNPLLSEKLSRSLKGNIPWNSGVESPYTPETIERMSQGQQKRFSENPGPNKGLVMPISRKQKIRDTMKQKGIKPSIDAQKAGGRKHVKSGQVSRASHFRWHVNGSIGNSGRYIGPKPNPRCILCSEESLVIAYA